MKLMIKTVDDLEVEALVQAKNSAHQTMLAALSQAAEAVTGSVPQPERDSWSTKAVAARAVLDGTATPEQSAMLNAECAVTREAVADLAASIVAKADAYSAFAASLSGLRRTTTTAIEGATMPEEVAACLTTLQNTLADMAGQGAS